MATIGLVLAGAVGACGVQGGDPTSGCTDETRTAGEPGDAEPLLTFGDAGLSPTIVYADGAVVIPADDVEALDGAAAFLHAPMMMPGYHGDQPGGFHGGWLSSCELGAVIERADDLFTDDVDFGSPQVTDLGTTNVTYADRTVSLYAFSRADPTEWSDLTRSQKQARQDLADLWTLVAESTELTGALEKDRLFVHFYGPIGDDEITDWPLSTPVSELSEPRSCTTVTDPSEIERLLERLDGDELLEESDWRLAVVAAAPGVPDC